MKSARVISTASLTIVLIAVLLSAAAARTPSTQLAMAGELDAVELERTPSLAVEQPMNIGPAERAKSLQVAQPMQSDVFDGIRRTPSLAIDTNPWAFDAIRRTPSLAVEQPMNVGPTERAKSLQVAQPMQSDVFDGIRRTPSLAVEQPMDIGPAERAPSQAVRDPLDITASGPTLSLNLKQASGVEVGIYSVSGRLIRTINESSLPSGSHSITWDGKDNNGCRAASGVYFARVQAEELTGKGKLVLVR